MLACNAATKRYLVRWEGNYPDSWEPERLVTSDLIDDFWEAAEPSPDEKDPEYFYKDCDFHDRLTDTEESSDGDSDEDDPGRDSLGNGTAAGRRTPACNSGAQQSGSSSSSSGSTIGGCPGLSAASRNAASRDFDSD